jgi:hypothetical protein
MLEFYKTSSDKRVFVNILNIRGNSIKSFISLIHVAKALMELIP